MKRSKKYQRNKKSRRQKTRQKKLRAKRYRTKSKTSRRRRTRKTKLKRGGGDEGGTTTAIAVPPPEVEPPEAPMKPPPVAPRRPSVHSLRPVIMRSNTPVVTNPIIYPYVEIVMWVWNDLLTRNADDGKRSLMWEKIIAGDLSKLLKTPPMKSRFSEAKILEHQHIVGLDLVEKTADSHINYIFGKGVDRIYLTLKRQKSKHHGKELKNLQVLRTSFREDEGCLPFLLAAEGYVQGNSGYMLSPFIGGYPIDLSATTTFLANMSMNEYTHPTVVEIIKCVACLHRYGLFHKDIKPANFVYGVSQEGKLFLKVIDTQDVQYCEPVSKGEVDASGFPSPSGMKVAAEAPKAVEGMAAVPEVGAPEESAETPGRPLALAGIGAREETSHHHMTPWYMSPYDLILDGYKPKGGHDLVAKAEELSALKMIDYWGVLMTIFDLFMCSIMDRRIFMMINQYEFKNHPTSENICMISGFGAWNGEGSQSRLFPNNVSCRLYASLEDSTFSAQGFRGGSLCMKKMDADPEQYNTWIESKVALIDGGPELFPQDKLSWTELMKIAPPVPGDTSKIDVTNTDLSPSQFMYLVFSKYPGHEFGNDYTRAVKEFNRIFETLFDIDRF